MYIHTTHNIEIYSIDPNNPTNDRNPGKYQHRSSIRYESYSTFVTSSSSKYIIKDVKNCRFDKIEIIPAIGDIITVISIAKKPKLLALLYIPPYMPPYILPIYIPRPKNQLKGRG